MIRFVQLGHPPAQVGARGWQWPKPAEPHTSIGNLRPCKGHGERLETEVSTAHKLEAHLLGEAQILSLGKHDDADGETRSL